MTPVPVTIEAEHTSIGGGLEDLVYTLTRAGDTTDALSVTVTLTQDETWLTAANLSHTVTFNAGEAEKGLTIPAADFSLAPTAKGDLTATVSGVGVGGDSVDVEVISIDHEPVTIAFDKTAYSFPEGGAAEEVDIYLTATVDAAFPRPPAEDFSVIGGLVPGTATVSEDFVSFSSVAMSFQPSEFTASVDAQQVARILFGPSGGNPLVIVDNDAYEGDETFGVQISLPVALGGLVRVKKADGTFCTGFCTNIRYPVTITDEDDLPELALAASPESIAEEDDDSTTGTVENVSTVTASITNSKTFATDQVLTLAFDDGGATYGMLYTVTLADGDANEAGHQVTLAAGQDSVSVTVTATANDTADGDRDITIAGALGGESFGSSVTITLRDDDPPNTPATGVPTIRGTAQVGETLSASTDDITDPDGKPANASDYTYQWQSVDEDGTSNETDIGTDSSTYTAVAADGTMRATARGRSPATAAVTGRRTAQVTASRDTYGPGETIELTHLRQGGHGGHDRRHGAADRPRPAAHGARRPTVRASGERPTSVTPTRGKRGRVRRERHRHHREQRRTTTAHGDRDTSARTADTRSRPTAVSFTGRDRGGDAGPGHHRGRARLPSAAGSRTWSIR